MTGPKFRLMTNTEMLLTPGHRHGSQTRKSPERRLLRKMSRVHKFSNVHYYERQIRALRSLVDRLVESAQVWSQLPSHARFGRLENMGQLQTYFDHIRGGIERGELTSRQVQEFRNLKRLVKDAMGMVKVLKKLDAELLEQERRDSE